MHAKTLSQPALDPIPSFHLSLHVPLAPPPCLPARPLPSFGLAGVKQNLPDVQHNGLHKLVAAPEVLVPNGTKMVLPLLLPLKPRPPPGHSSSGSSSSSSSSNNIVVVVVVVAVAVAVAVTVVVMIMVTMCRPSRHGRDRPTPQKELV